MEYNDRPTPEELKLLANDPIFPKGGFWYTRLLACAEEWEKTDVLLKKVNERLTRIKSTGAGW